ncbi:hypothetical protein CWO84_11840 [Methylomonas sp. Kb3]|uniref:hypothetical protein n=1 Tax=Methylomonas sp. Kb3 TaxID=1611544 RepID=UPI000C3214DD|nr:hypothetical protein [Methylomonas sp. Kb3]PKD40276.1 hypothetical protein CWO84_11840 [Methylomonas sp. Kb3]
MVEILTWLVLLGAGGPFKFVALLITLAAYLIVVWLTVSATWRWLRERRYRYLAVVLELTVLLVLPTGYFANHRSQKQQAIDTKLATMTKALDRYHELCKGAGEKIYRSVDDVDGVFLMKLEFDESSGISQYSIDAKSPYESLGDFDKSGLYKNDHAVGYMSFDGYIASFLRDKAISDRFPIEDVKNIKPLPAFRYVEAIDPSDHRRYRYTGSWQKVDTNDWDRWRKLIRKWGYIPREMLEPVDWIDGVRVEFVLSREPAGNPPPRYGVTYDDLETPEERKMWIAGSSLKVIDLGTGELLGQRIGYLHDGGGGASGSSRQPWAHAMRGKGWSCPSWFSPANNKPGFIFKILHPSKEIIHD